MEILDKFNELLREQAQQLEALYENEYPTDGQRVAKEVTQALSGVLFSLLFYVYSRYVKPENVLALFQADVTRAIDSYKELQLLNRTFEALGYSKEDAQSLIQLATEKWRQNNEL